MLRTILVAFTLMVASLSYAQDVTVKGTVTDSATGEPIPFASIQVQGTMKGCSTDADGLYTIVVPSDGVLVFSSIGYIQIVKQDCCCGYIHNRVNRANFVKMNFVNFKTVGCSFGFGNDPEYFFCEHVGFFAHFCLLEYV